MLSWRRFGEWRREQGESTLVDVSRLQPISRWRFVGELLVIYGLVVLSCAYLNYVSHAFDFLEQRIESLELNVYAKRNAARLEQLRHQIILVPISDDTFNDDKFRHLHSPPVPRSYHAHVINELMRAGAKVIAFDLLFEDARPEDTELAAAAKAAKRVVWACQWDDAEQTLLLPNVKLSQSSPYLGHTRTPYGEQNPVVDRFEVALANKPDGVPAFSVAAARLALGLEKQHFMPSANAWHLGSFEIPVDHDGTFKVSYLGKPGETFPTVPYEDVYKGVANDGMLRQNHFFRNKIVLIGDVTSLRHDNYFTPVGQMPGLEIHAHAIATLLQRSFIRATPPWAAIAMLCLLTALASLLAAVCTTRQAFGGLVLLLLAYFWAMVWLFVDHGLQLPFAAPAVASVLVTLAILTERGWFEQREQKRIANILGQYVSPQITTHGVPTGNVALLFTDIENSSSLSETFGVTFEKARQLHFELLRESLKRWNGFEIETAGDSLFAVFANPTEAVQFAVDAQLALSRCQWPVPLESLRVRMGIHMGEPFVAQDRLRLTYRGPATNRTARIMALAQGGEIFISASACSACLAAQAQAPTSISFTDMGTHTLKGVGQENIFRVCHPELSTNGTSNVQLLPTKTPSTA